MRLYLHADCPRANPKDWAGYQQHVKGQLGEFVTWYGPIDLLWFDGEWERTAEEWDTAGLEAHIRILAPDILIYGRLIGRGDYRTPEQSALLEGLAGWMVDNRQAVHGVSPRCGAVAAIWPQHGFW